MLTSIFRLLFALVIVMLVALHFMVGTPRAAGDNSRFIVFIHAGGQPKKKDAGAQQKQKDVGAQQAVPDEVIKQIAIALARKGYSVRPWDRQQDKPGVDYFWDQDAEAARDVAATVNEALPPLLTADDNATKLKERLQRIKNPQGYLGVWLF